MEATRDQLTQLIEDPVRFLEADDAVLRRMATTALNADQAAAAFERLTELSTDTDATVRAAAAEKIGLVGPALVSKMGLRTLEALCTDPEPTVREATATAYGEIGEESPLEWLVLAANGDPDRGVREAAIAALGAIGDDRAIDPLLDLIANGPPAVRRRSIAAITVFDDPRIEPAIQRAALDRNPGVREAAEMVVGRQLR
jgi:HEAT repeat protein